VCGADWWWCVCLAPSPPGGADNPPTEPMPPAPPTEPMPPAPYITLSVEARNECVGSTAGVAAEACTALVAPPKACTAPVAPLIVAPLIVAPLIVAPRIAGVKPVDALVKVALNTGVALAGTATLLLVGAEVVAGKVAALACKTKRLVAWIQGGDFSPPSKAF